MTEQSPSSLRALGSVDLQTRREQTHARLREAISSGLLAPGTHLAETELSEQLGVSRGTLREALRLLQQEGLVTSDARNRLSVRVVTEQEVTEIFDVRHALEALAFRLLCARPDREQVVKHLRVDLERLREVDGDVVAQLDADLEFHARLCELSGSTTLLHTWRSVSGLTRASITAAGTATALHNMAHDRHAPLVDHLSAGDVEGGVAFLSTHMREAAERIVAQMRASDPA